MRGLPVVVQLFLLVAAIGGFRAYAADGGAPSRPNFLIIIGDDCTYNDLPLHRMDQDPCELINLAGQAEHADAQQCLAKELDRWMRAQGDPGAAIDNERQWQASRKGEHLKQRK